MGLWLLLPLCGGSACAANYTFTNLVDNSGQFSDFGALAINDSGVVAFEGSLTNGVEGIYRTDGTTPVTIVDTATGQFSFHAGSFSLQSRPAIDDDGMVAFFIYQMLGPFNAAPGVWTGQGGPTAVVAEAGATNGPFSSVYSNPSIRNGVVSFFAQLTNAAGGPNGPNGVFTVAASGGSFNSIAQSGGKFLPGAPFGETSINAGGQVAFYGNLADGTSGIFVGPDGATTMAQTGPQSQFSSLDIYPKISDSGAVVFYGTLTNQTSGIFTSSTGTVTQITVAGGGQSEDEYPSINAAGTVACYGTLSSGERAILAGTGPVIDQVIAEGDSLFGSTVIGLREPGSNGLNNHGQIVFVYVLDNGVEGIAVATPANNPVPIAPVLYLKSIDSSDATFSWPAGAIGFTLQSTTQLGPSPVWTTNSATPLIVNGQYTVTIPISGPQQFFRLSQ
jgi:hypothetical protein